MEKQVSIVLAGIGGYGNNYLRSIFNRYNETSSLKAVVDVSPERSDFYQEILDKEIPIFSSLEEFYEEYDAELAIISTPIHLHKDQACLAMENGSHVLCEKPATADLDHLQEMIETRDRTGKQLAIGFNWSFTKAVQELKNDIMSGKFGKPLKMKSLVLWPRTADYFNRSSWAGKKFSPDGERIFDSVANNATAHYLHHLFYLLGDSTETSAEIDHLTAELYRANPIETFDTCAVKVQTKNNVEITYLASHAVPDNHRPKYMLEFEEATIIYHPTEEDSEIIVKMKNGEEKRYDDPEKDRPVKLGVMIDFINGEKESVLCGPEAASTHVKAIYNMHQSVKDIPEFPEEVIEYDAEQKLTTVKDLDKILMECYEKECLPSDLDISWSKLGEKINL